MTRLLFIIATLLFTPLLFTTLATAEPYFAVREGMNCASCHVNSSGGGMRNSFGNNYGQTQLAVSTLLPDDKAWSGELVAPISIGGNGRYSARYFDIDDVDTNTNFAVDRTTIYISAALNDNITFMLDQQVAPGGSLNRESWVQVKHNAWYLKAGKIFQPFGWRLEDDSAFVRQVTGINFTNGDNGFELGYEKGAWSSQLAFTNGAGGGNDVDDGKQASFRLSRASTNFQWGVNANFNNTDNGERTITGFFFGLNTGPITWLGEWDHIADKDFVGGDVDQNLALLEANYLITKGHNLKLTVEAQQFDNDSIINTEDRMRYSLVWEYFPVSFSQFRLGLRERDGEDPNPIIDAQLNSSEIFAQLHVYF